MSELYKKCECCKLNSVEVVKNIGAENPYRICSDCDRRLDKYALRPLEYFNMVAAHGHMGLLHDDFYENETGDATQPKIPVSETEKYPFPVLDEIKNDLLTLIDYAIVQIETSDEVVSLLKKFEKKEVLARLSSKVEYNRAINYRVYDIVAHVLAVFAEDWIKKEWRNRRESELAIFVLAIVECVPFQEAFSMIEEAVSSSNNSDLSDNIGAFLYFETTQTLDWIESNAHRITNVSASWGVLAAASKFDWKRAQNWLEAGRPLSLISLDALLYSTTIGSRSNQALWLQRKPPILLDAPKPEVIANKLKEFLQKDNVPRTRNTSLQIINNLFHVID